MGKNLNFEVSDEETYWQWKRQKDDGEFSNWFEFFEHHVDEGEQ